MIKTQNQRENDKTVDKKLSLTLGFGDKMRDVPRDLFLEK